MAEEDSILCLTRKRFSDSPHLTFIYTTCRWYLPRTSSFLYPDFCVQFSSVQLLSRVWLFATAWTAPRQASLSITNSRACSNPCPLSLWCHLTIRCCPLLLLPSIIPNIRVFSNFYVKYCLKFPPWGVGAGGRKGTSFLLPVCIPISLSHTQVHLTLNHPQARTFQCCDLPQNKDIFLSTKLRSDCPN